MALIRRGIHFDTHGADDGAAVFGRLAEAARLAEDAGFDAISVPDHLYDPGGPAFPMFEAYTVLGALASSARTLAAAGVDGMIVACREDPARIAAIGQILGESFPS
jgi:alkanesulfonate monooxygenase SsuD/methylene tetrahydromethanopterin reductase-like flavin-dependent oxidoreductase (luciferase family)